MLLKATDNFGRNEVFYVKIGGWVQELWYDTFFRPKWCKCSFQTPDPKVTNVFKISSFYLKQLAFLDKMRSCMLELVVTLRSHGLICLSDLSCPNVVSRPDNQKLQNFLRFDGFNESNWWFLIEWGLVCEICGRVQELGLDTFFWPKWSKCSLYAPDTKVTTFFDISWFCGKQLRILDKMKSCLWKLILRLRSYGLIRLLGPSNPNVISRPKTPKL